MYLIYILKGRNGERGDSGNSGRVGQTGAQGDSGSIGTTGSPGLPGTPGLQGDPGSVGESGRDRQPGEKGLKGISGLDREPVSNFENIFEKLLFNNFCRVILEKLVIRDQRVSLVRMVHKVISGDRVQMDVKEHKVPLVAQGDQEPQVFQVPLDHLDKSVSMEITEGLAQL